MEPAEKIKVQNNNFQRSLSKQYFYGVLANFTSIAPSMSLGFSAVALPILKDSLNSSQQSWFASIASLATPFGCFVAGPFADRFGRQKAMMLANIICFLGWIVLAVACSNKKYFWSLILGRILTGISTGLCSSPPPVYMAEISTPELRSVFMTWTSSTFSIGVLIVYFLGYILQDKLTLLCCITAVLPAIGLLFTKFLIPESPTWLVSKNKFKEARASICKIFDTKLCTPVVEAELENLINTQYKTSASKSNINQFRENIVFLFQPYCLRAMGFVLTFFVIQQFSGIFVIIFYAIDIVNKVDVNINSYIVIVVIGVVRLLSGILASFLAKYFGRRPICIFSGSAMAFCLLPLALYMYEKQIGNISTNNYFIIPLLLLLLFISTSSIGFLPFPFALAAELFPSKIRGTAAGIMGGMGYFFSFIAVKTYPDMISYLGKSGVFCFYGCVSLVGTIYLFFKLPETRNRTLQELTEHFGMAKKQTEEVEL